MKENKIKILDKLSKLKKKKMKKMKILLQKHNKFWIYQK